MGYFPIKGEKKENVIRLKGDGARYMYFNYSRRLLYFREGEAIQQGRFADVKYESILGSHVLKYKE